MQKILILRGAPGSGKTTIAEKYYSNEKWVTVSADHFFFVAPDTYTFIPSLIQEAHDQAYGRTLTALEEGKNICVDNTNKKIWEFQKYLDLASSKVEVKVFLVPTYFGSTKNVPSHVVDNYYNQYERFPREGRMSIINGKLMMK